MRKKRILIFSGEGLLGESIERMLLQFSDVELAGHWRADETVVERITLALPDLVILADDGRPGKSFSRMAGQILERCPNLPILRVTLESNQVQVYSSHLAPASSHELFDLIHRLPIDD